MTFNSSQIMQGNHTAIQGNNFKAAHDSITAFVHGSCALSKAKGPYLVSKVAPWLPHALLTGRTSFSRSVCYVYVCAYWETSIAQFVCKS